MYMYIHSPVLEDNYFYSWTSPNTASLSFLKDLSNDEDILIKQIN